MRQLVILLCFLIGLPTLRSTTLEECHRAAVANYPAIVQYDLIGRTSELTVSDINKKWLPQVSVSAQATLQSAVTSWPSEMQTTFHTLGVDLDGLKKDQYRVGIDVSQTLYDGGASRSERKVARAQGLVDASSLAVTLYSIKGRVNEMYFSALLVEDRIRLGNDLVVVLQTNEDKLRSMYERGAAARSDYLSVKAERLRASQQVEQMTSQRLTLLRSLSTFCGLAVDSLVVPEAEMPSPVVNRRPELDYYDATLELAAAREKELDSRILPRVNLFAQGFYGYPGYNMFEDMMRRRFSFNGMVGLKVTWNIGALYSRGNDKARLQLMRSTAESNRAAFLLNNELEQMRQDDEYTLYSRLLMSDREIVELRTSVRKSAESRLDHGIIDVHDLIKETTAEHDALVQMSIHNIEMIKRLYDIKLSTNN